MIKARNLHMPKPGMLISSIYGKFFHVLIALIVFLLLYACLINHETMRILVEISFSIVMLASVMAVSENRSNFLIAGVLFVFVLISRWAADFDKNVTLLLISNMFTIINLVFIAGTMLATIIQRKEISLDDVYGTICVYLLVGLVFAFLFFSIESYYPGAFNFTAMGPVSASTQLINLIYFSFITITTVGYGDILPISMMAKTLSYMEAIFGQVYLTVLVARLIAIYVADLARKGK